MIEFWFPIIFMVAVVVLVAVIFRPGQYSVQVSPIEAGLIVVVGFLTVWLLWSWGISQRVTDTENLSGVIAEKGYSDVACRHCRTICDSRDDKGNCTVSHEECDHPFDRVWWAKTDYVKYFPNEGTIYFPTTDRQGLVQPERWTYVAVGEPATTLHSYTNWLRGAGKDSILFPSSYQTKALAEHGFFPPRMQSFFDGYYTQPRAIYVGLHPAGMMTKVSEYVYIDDNLTGWSMDANSRIGPEKQGNLQIFLVEYPDMEYANAYMDYHKGGAKNDINVFVGVDSIWRPIWVQVKFGLPGFDQTEIDGKNSSNALLAVKIHDEIMAQEYVAGYNVVEISARLVMEGFDRVPNKQFEYLKDQLKPDQGMMNAIWILLVIYLCGSTVVALATEELDIQS